MVQERFTIGWAEWVTLPDLGLPAIKAKVDTGAKTSALHAFQIEPFGPPDAPRVRFGVRPIPGRPEITVFCSAPVIDWRTVISSNGEREVRCVIETTVSMGGRTWPIELTLANRETMAYRMLLGRQAIRGDMRVDPAISYLQPKLGYRYYRNVRPRKQVHRPLRIALLTRRPKSTSARMLRQAGAARGHVLEPLNPARLSLVLDANEPTLLKGKAPLAHYDAVIPRLLAEDGAFGAAAVRQLELTGSYSINSGDALQRLLSGIAPWQRLAGVGINGPVRTYTGAQSEAMNGARDFAKAGVDASVLRFLVIGGRVTAVNARPDRTGRGVQIDSLGDVAVERALAERAAEALELGFASIDVARGETGPAVVRVSAVPSLGAFAAASDGSVAEAVIAVIEARVRSWRRAPEAAIGGVAER